MRITAITFGNTPGSYGLATWEEGPSALEKDGEADCMIMGGLDPSASVYLPSRNWLRLATADMLLGNLTCRSQLVQ